MAMVLLLHNCYCSCLSPRDEWPKLCQAPPPQSHCCVYRLPGSFWGLGYERRSDIVLTYNPLVCSQVKENIDINIIPLSSCIA